MGEVSKNILGMQNSCVFMACWECVFIERDLKLSSYKIQEGRKFGFIVVDFPTVSNIATKLFMLFPIKLCF